MNHPSVFAFKQKAASGSIWIQSACHCTSQVAKCSRACDSLMTWVNTRAQPETQPAAWGVKGQGTGIN